MSAAPGPDKKRVPLDQYETPAWCVDRLFEDLDGEVSTLRGGRWLEPCAGAGELVKRASVVHGDETMRWTVAEIDPRYREDLEMMRLGIALGDPRADPRIEGNRAKVVIGDFRQFRLEPGATSFDVAITNPPFSLAFEILLHCRHIARHTFLLLRAGFLESEERADFLRRDAPDVRVLPNRPSFRLDGGTDSSAYAWCHWGPKPHATGTLRVLRPTPQKVRKAQWLEMFGRAVRRGDAPDYSSPERD